MTAKKTIVITGATAGIGLAAARAFARQGHDLVLVGRNAEKLAAVSEELRALGASVDVERCDLANVAETRAAGRRLRSRLVRLDVLVHNAGAYFVDRATQEEGLERTFATNHLAPFVLTAELRDLLVASAPSRVVITASDAHRAVRGLDFRDLQNQRWGLSGFRAYGASKLANILFTRELARQLEGTGVTAHCYHPGVVGSDFAKNNGALGKIAMAVARPFARTVEQGADTLVWLATAPEVTGSGGYWQDRKEIAPSSGGRDAQAAARLWAMSSEIVASLGAASAAE